MVEDILGRGDRAVVLGYRVTLYWVVHACYIDANESDTAIMLGKASP